MVVVPRFQTVPVPVTVQVPEPRATERTLVPDELKMPVVTLNPFASKLPTNTVNVAVEAVARLL